MFDRILAYLASPPAAAPGALASPYPRRDVAVAALLVELAQSDRRLAGRELATVERIVRERFGMDEAGAARLVEAARRELAASLEDWVFAHAVREGFDAAERGEIVALLWEVVYADGRLARLEESQMRRIAAALGVSDAEREAARAQAFARRGKPAASGTPEAE